MILQQIISQSNTSEPFYDNKMFVDSPIIRAGFYSEVSPTTLYYNGKTFTTAISDADTNNIPYVFELNNSVGDYFKFPSGTFSKDVYGHPKPALHIDDLGFIYLLQVNPHVAPIRVYKSNTSGTISDGFTLLGEIPITSSYMLIYDTNDTSIKILTRTGGDGWGHRIISVDLNNLAGATSYDVTQSDLATTDVRHYPSKVLKYGVSTREWFVINHRDEVNKNVYKSSLYYFEKSNPNIIRNSTNTYSKDISVSLLTEAELEANGFAINGSNSNRGVANLGMLPCQVGDVVYVNERVSMDVWRIMKIDELNNRTYSVIVPFLKDAGLMSIHYTGNNLILQVKEDNYIYIYSLTLSLTNLKVEKVIPYVDDLVDFPQNIDEISGGYDIVKTNIKENYIEWIHTNDFIFI